MNEQRREIEDSETAVSQRTEGRAEAGGKPEIKEEVGFVCWLTCRFAKMN